MTQLENSNRVEAKDLNPAEGLDPNSAKKVDLSNVTDELPVDEETLKGIDSLQKEGNDFINLVENDKELSDSVKKMFPNTYKLAKNTLKKWAEVKGKEMTNREAKELTNGLINSLTPILKNIEGMLKNPNTIAKMKMIKEQGGEILKKLGKAGFIKVAELNMNPQEVEENSNNQLVNLELEEIETNPALKELSDALKKDLVRDVKYIKRQMKESNHLTIQEKLRIRIDVSKKVDQIIQAIDKISKSERVYQYAGLIISKLNHIKESLGENNADTLNEKKSGNNIN